MRRSTGRLLTGALNNDDLLIFCSTGEWSRKPVKNVAREILIIAIGDGALQEISLHRSYWVVHVESILSQGRTCCGTDGSTSVETRRRGQKRRKKKKLGSSHEKGAPQVAIRAIVQCQSTSRLILSWWGKVS